MSALRTSILRTFRLSDPTPDAVLVRAAAAGEADAFPALVARHGPMVLRVCRQLLGDAHAAEDAFQAVFLVLARRVGRLRRPERLAAWLFGTARHLALKAKRTDCRRRRREESRTPSSAREPLDELTGRELLAALDEEIERLPEAYRLPLLLCYWQGLTQDQAARRLGWTPGSVKGRLERGRKQLAARLTKRGLAPTVLLVAALSPTVVPGELIASTVAFAVPGAVVPAGVLALTATAGTTKLLSAGAMAALLAGAGLVGLAGGFASPQAPGSPNAPPTQPVAKVGPRVDAYGDPLPEGAVARLGTVRYRHGDGIYAACISADGQLLASTGGNNGTNIWDAMSGKKTCEIRGPDFQAEDAVAFSPDGKVLAVGGRGGVFLCDSRSGTVLRKLPIGTVLSLAFSADGKCLAAGTEYDGTILLENASGNRLHRLQAKPKPKPGSIADLNGALVWSLAFSPNGTILATIENELVPFPVREFRVS